jgi:hypothetical protein
MKNVKYYQDQFLQAVSQRNHCQELLYWWHDAYPPKDELQRSLVGHNIAVEQWRQLYENAQEAAE